MAVPSFVLPPIIAAGEGSDTDLIPTPVIAPGGGGSFAAFRLFQGREPQTLSLMQQVAVAAVERIVDRRYPPGSHLAEHALAEEFHTSKAPVSEALVLVESTGLLDYASRRSARVAEMSLADFDDLMNYRTVLELPVGNGFMERRGADTVAFLLRATDEMERIIDDDSRAFTFVELADRIVLHLARHSGQRRISRALNLISLQYLRYSYLGFRSVKDRRLVLANWRTALRAIETGNLGELEAAHGALTRVRYEVIASQLRRAQRGQ